MAHRLIEQFRLQAKRSPDAIIVRDRVHEINVTAGMLLATAEQYAHTIDEKAAPGATILIDLPSSAAFIAALLGVWGTGRRALPIAQGLCDDDREGLVAAHQPAAHIAQALDFESTSPRAQLDRAEKASLLLMSSGTLGQPRAALRSARALDNVAQTLRTTLALDAHDSILSTLPMHHAFGLEHAVLLPIVSGAAVIVLSGMQFDAIESELETGATILPTVPPTLGSLADRAPPAHTLRLAYTAGAPLPAHTQECFERNWSVRVADLYGASEVGTITWGFDGQCFPVNGVECRCANGGELLVRSDAMFEGYLDTADGPLAHDSTQEGWFQTGDLAHINDDGSVQLLGRSRIQFDVGGLKVNPPHVESVLEQHDAIAMALVKPLALNDTVNRVQAAVVLREGTNVSLEELRDHARKHLRAHEVPRQINFVESLPRTPSGKLIRRAVGRSTQTQTSPLR